MHVNMNHTIMRFMTAKTMYKVRKYGGIDTWLRDSTDTQYSQVPTLYTLNTPNILNALDTLNTPNPLQHSASYCDIVNRLNTHCKFAKTDTQCDIHCDTHCSGTGSNILIAATYSLQQHSLRHVSGIEYVTVKVSLASLTQHSLQQTSNTHCDIHCSNA